jgi:hypothetical protein
MMVWFKLDNWVVSDFSMGVTKSVMLGDTEQLAPVLITIGGFDGREEPVLA